ncbi:MAG: GNAT family N-acetyltransferase [Clostridia bacterium]|nr:GNAT family N-acetyltransferase [Clostridia bacterium]
MLIRQARMQDANDLKHLYFTYLSANPPKEEQDMSAWQNLIEDLLQSKRDYLLVAEEDGKVVSSIQLAIVPVLTHNLRPYGVIENVVTHADYRNRGYASALLSRATEICREMNCYKVFLETGSKRESTLRFYEKNGFMLDQKRSCLKRL